MITIREAASCCLSLSLALATYSLQAAMIDGDLPRSADIGFAAGIMDGHLLVVEIDAGSPAAKAGLAVDDELIAINGVVVSNLLAALDQLEKQTGESSLRLDVVRDGKNLALEFEPPAREFEQIDGVDSHYGDVRVGDNAWLRTIVTTPAGTNEPLPALLFTQWVSCGSVEVLDQSTSGRIHTELARQSGFAFVRVERSSSGDSQGPACHELDYDTEIEHYVEAFDHLLRSDERLDKDTIVVLGSSLGSTTAPLVARALEERGWDIDGVAVGGGGALTYLERMINFDRWYLERRPDAVAPEEIHQSMNDRIRFHYEYLVEERHPDDVATDSPAMAAVREDIRGMENGAHYGRPYSYHQQAAQANHLAAWTELDARAWVVFGEFDQFEALHGHRLIVDMVNRIHPGNATWIYLPNVDHGYWVYPTVETAYADEQGVRAIRLYVEPLLAWLNNEID